MKSAVIVTRVSTAPNAMITDLYHSDLPIFHYHSCCSYFIPEDGDIEGYPNVFLAPKPRQQGMPPTLAQVRESFPLPGRYHFRFKSPLVPGGDREKGGMAVWMDCVHDSQAIPTWRNSIIAKVSRVAVEEDDDDDDDFPSAAPTPVPPKQRQAAPPPPRHTESSEPLLDVFDGGHSSGSAHSSHHSSTADLLNSAPPVPAAPTSGGSLLDMDGPHYNHHGNQHGNSVHHDFMGMTAPPVTPSQPPAGYGRQQQQQPTPQQPQRQQQQRPPQQQQAPPPQQQQPQRNNNANAFDSFTTNKGGNKDQDPFGGMSWT